MERLKLACALSLATITLTGCSTSPVGAEELSPPPPRVLTVNPDESSGFLNEEAPVDEQGSEVAIEYDGACLSGEALNNPDSVTCSRWRVNGRVAEIFGRGQLIYPNDPDSSMPTIWTFGTFIEGSCQAGSLETTCQTQDKNEIIWVNEDDSSQRDHVRPALTNRNTHLPGSFKDFVRKKGFRKGFF